MQKSPQFLFSNASEIGRRKYKRVAIVKIGDERGKRKEESLTDVGSNDTGLGIHDPASHKS